MPVDLPNLFNQQTHIQSYLKADTLL